VKTLEKQLAKIFVTEFKVVFFLFQVSVFPQASLVLLNASQTHTLVVSNGGLPVSLTNEC
jgi:hypothetical protein